MRAPVASASATAVEEQEAMTDWQDRWTIRPSILSTIGGTRIELPATWPHEGGTLWMLTRESRRSRQRCKAFLDRKWRGRGARTPERTSWSMTRTTQQQLEEK